MSPVRFSDGTTIGPVALVCTTVVLLGVLAGFIILVIVAPEESEAYIRPLIPAAAAIATGVALWIRMHASDKNTTHQNQTIYNAAQEAATKAEDAAETVGRRLNGELDGRIQAAVRAAMETYDQEKDNR